ncbi:MAG TPA: FHA domain-containing protein [Streptosporangiaceae bacterium]|nr:FHA domain-containing protein [Streptosporangiaceae bacterium]
MSDLNHPPGLWPVPGDGVLARHGDLILLSSLESGQFADVLLDLLEQISGSGGDGRRFADAVADALEIEAMGGAAGEGAGAETDSAPGPSVLAFGPAGSGLAVTVSGSAWADVVTAHGVQRIAAGQPGMLLRCLLRSPASAVRGGLGPSGDGEARTDRFSRLDGGTLRAGGLAYIPGAGAYQRRAAAAPGEADRQAADLAASPAEHAPPDQPLPDQPLPDQPLPDQPLPDQPLPDQPLPDQLLAGAPLAGGPPEAPPAEPEPAQHAVPDLPAPADAPAAEPPPAAAAAEPEWARHAIPDQQPPADQPPAGGLPAEFPAGGLPGEQFPAAEPWPPVRGEAAPGERWPTAAVLIPGTPPADIPGTALAEQPQSPPLLPQVEAGDLAGREATIAPVGGQPFEAVLLSGPAGAELNVPGRPPLSKAKDLPPGTSSYSEGLIIQGVYCKNGHFDDPEALFCAVCGISMNQQTLVPRPGPRPPLGVLVLDDGSVFQLDKDYIIGREPSLDASVASGRARPLRVADDSGIVSRVHARVQLDGWRVLMTDLGSANGTRVKLPRQPADQTLLPQVPIVLGPGSQIDLGGRVLRYESHRGR